LRHGSQQPMSLSACLFSDMQLHRVRPDISSVSSQHCIISQLVNE